MPTGIVFNPGGLTHTSVACHDAIKGISVPTIECHISNIHAREPWRNHSYISFAAKAVICGFGIQGYALAIDGLAAMTGQEEQALSIVRRQSPRKPGSTRS